MKQGLSLVTISLLLLNLTLTNSTPAHSERLFSTPATEAPPSSNEINDATVITSDDEDEDDEGCS